MGVSLSPLRTTEMKKIRNPVARHMEKFNRPATYRDRTKYTRKRKYKNELYERTNRKDYSNL